MPHHHRNQWTRYLVIAIGSAKVVYASPIYDEALAWAKKQSEPHLVYYTLFKIDWELWHNTEADIGSTTRIEAALSLAELSSVFVPAPFPSSGWPAHPESPTEESA